MFTLIVELQAKPESVHELEAALHALVDHSRSESGNLAYSMHRRHDDQFGFLLYELYCNRAAWEAHMALPPVSQILDKFAGWLQCEPKITFCDLLDKRSVNALL
ncbi:MAG: putative quinol monooxygenase [Burkholderiaceae bacterium]